MTIFENRRIAGNDSVDCSRSTLPSFVKTRAHSTHSLYIYNVRKFFQFSSNSEKLYDHTCKFELLLVAVVF